MEDKCPFCGANYDIDAGLKFTYQCGTEASGSTANIIYRRSRTCYEWEIAALKEDCQAMKSWVDGLTKACEATEDFFVNPAVMEKKKP